MSDYKIIYHPSRFGIYDVDSLRIIENIYAFNFNKNSGINDYTKSFLIKNGRSPDDDDIDYMTRLENGEKAPHNAYWFNWCSYAIQNIQIEYPLLPPPTEKILEISQKLFGHKINEHYVHIINKQVRFKSHKISKNWIYGVNVWQIMSTIKTSELLRITKNEKSMSLLFNKIYKREPTDKELECCIKINIHKPAEEMENEIKSIVEVKSEKVVSIRRDRRNRQFSQK